MSLRDLGLVFCGMMIFRCVHMCYLILDMRKEEQRENKDRYR